MDLNTFFIDNGKCGCLPDLTIPSQFENAISYEQQIKIIWRKYMEMGKWLSELAEIVNAKYPTYILVEAYGAIGDGKTDSTKAIQKCIDENPNSTIMFRGGTYVISDKLVVKGNQGGQTIIFGGAHIKWGGAISNDYMLAIDSVSDAESRATIIGGTFNCMGKVDGGIHVNMYHSTVQDCKIMDFTSHGIAIGTAGGARSLQCVCRNLYIFVSNTSGLPFTEGNDFVGVACYEPDNMFSQINVLRCYTAVYILANGQEFSECHFTAGFKTPQKTLPMSRAIYLDPSSTTSINCNTFSQIYFDSFRVMFYCNGSNRLNNLVSNSKFFGQYELDESVLDTVFDAYMLYGGYTDLKLDNFIYIPVKSNVELRDPSWNLTSLQYIGFANQNNCAMPDTVIALKSRSLLSQLFIVKPGMWRKVSSSLNYTGNNCYRIAQFMATNQQNFGKIILTLTNRTYLYATVTIRGYVSSTGYYFTAEVPYGQNNYFLYLVMGADVNNKKVIEIWLKCDQSTSQYIEMKADFNNNVVAFINESAMYLGDVTTLNPYATISLFPT